MSLKRKYLRKSDENNENESNEYKIKIVIKSHSVQKKKINKPMPEPMSTKISFLLIS
jgi:hypothetical protein